MGRRILLIDDDLSQLDLLDRALSRKGFDVFITTKAELALDMIATVKPEVVLLDLMMPNIDGYSVIKNIRDSRELSKQKIIVLSADKSPEAETRAMELGANLFILKPINFDKLKDRIEKIAENN